jgi:hypothetical protein
MLAQFDPYAGIHRVECPSQLNLIYLQMLLVKDEVARAM